MKIETCLPGKCRTLVVPFSSTYKLTVERSDGIACTEIEAKTVMYMICGDLLQKRSGSPIKNEI